MKKPKCYICKKCGQTHYEVKKKKPIYCRNPDCSRKLNKIETIIQFVQC